MFHPLPPALEGNEPFYVFAISCVPLLLYLCYYFSYLVLYWSVNCVQLHNVSNLKWALWVLYVFAAAPVVYLRNFPHSQNETHLAPSNFPTVRLLWRGLESGCFCVCSCIEKFHSICTVFFQRFFVRPKFYVLKQSFHNSSIKLDQPKIGKLTWLQCTLNLKLSPRTT